jgi:hypothetical protein
MTFLTHFYKIRLPKNSFAGSLIVLFTKTFHAACKPATALSALLLLLIPLSFINCSSDNEVNLADTYTWTLKSDSYTLLSGQTANLSLVRSDGQTMPADQCTFTDTLGTRRYDASFAPTDTGTYYVKGIYSYKNKQYTSRNSIQLQVVNTKVAQIKRAPWMWTNPLGDETPVLTVGTSSPLIFDSGTPADENDDKTFSLTFPTTDTPYGKVILQYTMGGAVDGPGKWDQSVQFFVKDKNTGEWYQILSAITPYGSKWNASWKKVFYLDVTEFMPLLTGETQFRYFGGGPTEENRYHTADLQFHFYTGIKERTTAYHAKVYDSGHNPSTWNSRSWRYGVATNDIEDASRLGPRTFTIPDDGKDLELRFSITGHGNDSGTYPNRPDYTCKGCAEFDENYYYFRLNGTLLTDVKGDIWYNNRIYNYEQGGLSRVPRSNWGPGLPVNIQYWAIKEIPANRVVTLDIDLEPFVTEGSYSQYILAADLYGYK